MLYGAALCAGLLLTRLVMKEALVMMKESSTAFDLEVRTPSTHPHSHPPHLTSPDCLFDAVQCSVTDGGWMGRVAWSTEGAEGAAAAWEQGR